MKLKYLLEAIRRIVYYRCDRYVFNGDEGEVIEVSTHDVIRISKEQFEREQKAVTEIREILSQKRQTKEIKKVLDILQETFGLE